MLRNSKYKFDYVETGALLNGSLFELMGNQLRWKSGFILANEDLSDTLEYVDLQGRPLNPEEV